MLQKNCYLHLQDFNLPIKTTWQHITEDSNIQSPLWEPQITQNIAPLL